MSEVSIKIPEKLIPVFLGEADFRGAFGGRGSGKTRSFAKMIAVRGFIYGRMGLKGQLLCARQFMNSLSDSSLEECKRAIESESFLSDFYEIGERYIKSRDGNIHFNFSGLDRNIASIKSKGRILICWIDEAEPVTEYAFSVLVPTLREEGDGWNAELWVTWNPGSKSSAVHKRFREIKNPRAKIVELNWQDNPWFPEILNRSRTDDYIERPDSYDHIWEGAFGNIQGSILGKWIAKARRENRINSNTFFDPEGYPVEISCDLGFSDTASWWYWQRVFGGFKLLKYEGGSGLDADEWIPIIQKNILDLGAKNVGKIWLPHDAKVKTFQSSHSTIERFISAFGSGKVDIVPVSRKMDRINAARTVIDRCSFNADYCESGIDGLESWEFEYKHDLEIFSKEPVHNWASHPSDAFSYGCQVMQEVFLPLKNSEDRYFLKGSGNGSGRIVTASLNEMWNEIKKKDDRL